MNDYSDLLFLIGAIAIYGLLVNNTNRSLVLNNQILNDSEIEYGAISVAQDILEEARWVKYDNLNEAQLESHSDNPLYSVDVDLIDISGGTGDKEVLVTVTSDFLKNPDGTPSEITMSMIKTDYED